MHFLKNEIYNLQVISISLSVKYMQGDLKFFFSGNKLKAKLVFMKKLTGIMILSKFDGD